MKFGTEVKKHDNFFLLIEIFIFKKDMGASGGPQINNTYGD